MIKCTRTHLLALTLIVAFSLQPKRSAAWGPEGHAIVGKIAMQFLKPEVKQNVLALLGNMSIDTATNWMDIMRSNSDYDFMKPWHYIDFAKEKQYLPSTDENIVNRLIITLNELRHKKVLCTEQIRMDLFVLLHLMGDLHQPLHAGYDDDLGGNKRAVQYETLKTNLHSFWDEDIIRLNNITLQSCLDLYASYNGAPIDTIKGIHPALWMKETRSHLGMVYDFQEFFITKAYLKKAEPIVKKQLLVAGLRLAEILNKLFTSDAPVLNLQEVAARYKNGIEAKDAASNIKKKVTACGRVYGVKTTDKVTFINVGDKFPKSPLTVVIFAKDRSKFPQSLEEMYNDKNICVKGEIIDYQGKAEIIVTSPDDITVVNQ